MTAPRTLAAASALLLFAAVPAMAQTDQEIIGRYRLTVEPEPGSMCPPGETDFDVTRVGGRLIEVSLDHTSTIADWDPDRKSFAGTINFPDPEHPIRVNGSFSRGPEKVNLVVTVEFPPDRPCKALLSGSIDADPVDAATTGSMDGSAPPAPGIPPSPTAPPVFGVAPNGAPVTYGPPAAPAPSGPMAMLKDWKVLAGLGGGLLLIGILVGAMRGKARKAAVVPPPAAPKPPPAPKPEPEPEAEPEPEPAAPAPKAPRKPRAAKPKPTEEEDELGDG